MTQGLTKGEICNRDGCIGIIAEHDKEGRCSCHINPPCGYCTTDTAYCPTCDWSAEEEMREYNIPVSQSEKDYWSAQNEKWKQERESFYRKYNGKEPATKLELRHESHTHFTQKWLGVFPSGTETSTSILEKHPEIKGTFGGRFNMICEYKFEYIAYTD